MKKSWESIKDNCKKDAYLMLQQPYNQELTGLLCLVSVAHIIETNSIPLHGEIIKEAQDKVCAEINSWDIRNYTNLSKQFPKYFPSWVRKGKCTVELTDEGWMFIKKI